MVKRKKKILFLNHSASRTGASILLLDSLRWLKANSDFDIEVLSKGPGPLIDDFKDVAITKVWRGRSYMLNLAPPRLAAWLRPKLEALHLKIFLRGSHYDLVYANTAAAGQYVAALNGFYDVLLWHIHELSSNLQLFLGQQGIQDLFPLASRFIAVSQQVSNALTGECHVPKDRVDLIHGFVPLRKSNPSDRHNKRQDILTSFDWPADAFVVGGCGTLGWRKGTDLFLQMARCISESKEGENVRFLWVGGGDYHDDSETITFDHDLRALGLGHLCRRVPCTPDVDDYYCGMDVFALTSREDPFPLVMLEAAMHELPVVCFSGSGGGAEFVAEDSGLIARYADVNEFAERLLTLKTSPELRRRLGEAGRRKVEKNHTIDVQGPKLLQSILKCLQETEIVGVDDKTSLVFENITKPG